MLVRNMRFFSFVFMSIGAVFASSRDLKAPEDVHHDLVSILAGEVREDGSVEWLYSRGSFGIRNVRHMTALSVAAVRAISPLPVGYHLISKRMSPHGSIVLIGKGACSNNFSITLKHRGVVTTTFASFVIPPYDSSHISDWPCVDGVRKDFETALHRLSSDEGVIKTFLNNCFGKGCFHEGCELTIEAVLDKK